MQTGDVVLIDFPFSDYTASKIRPAVIVNITKDKYKDVIICFISSVVSVIKNDLEIILTPDSVNNLRAVSVLKVYRIATVKNSMIVSVISKLNQDEAEQFKKLFKSLAE